MKLILKIILLLLISAASYAQNFSMGIETNTAEGVLDINSSKYGIIFPRVALLSVFDETTITNPDLSKKITEGTIIWNTTLDVNNNNTTTKLTPGFYIWQNPRWRRINNQDAVIENDQKGFNTPNFSTTNCLSGTWYELESNLGTTFSANEDEITNVSFYYTQPANSICEIEVKLNFTTQNANRLEIFLKAPSGEIIELIDGDGPSSGITATFNSTFTATATNNLNNWGILTPTFNATNVTAKGITNPSILTNHYTKSSINNFSELSSKNPQGEWEIIINNRSLLYVMTVNDLKLRIKAREDYSGAGNYKLEKQIVYNSKHSNILNLYSVFEAQVKSNILHTVITKSTTPITVTNTNDINLLNILHVNTKMNTGISWVQSNNQIIDKNLSENTTYYYQLWYKGDIEGVNKKHSIIINGMSDQ